MTTETEESIQGNALDELKRKLDESEELGNKLIEKGHRLTEAGQFMVDIARTTRDAVHVYRPVRNIEFLIDGLDIHISQAGVALAHLDDVDLPSFDSTGGTVAYTISAAFNPLEVQSIVPEEDWAEARNRTSRVQEVASRMASKDGVIELMRSLGLDMAPQGRKSPLELFETANKAFENPVPGSNPATSLIPMRESIRASIEFLLKERPIQEKASNERDKILSIGRQLKRDSIPSETIESLAHQWEDILSKLSSAKQQDICREEWQFLLHQSILFLKSLLAAIDPYKLRSRLKYDPPISRRITSR